LLYENGNLYKNGSEHSGKTSRFTQRTVQALDQIRTGGDRGNALVTGLQNSSDNVVIKSSGSNRIEFPTSSNNLSDITVSFAPTSTSGGPNQDGNRQRPAYIGLAHELAHAEDKINGTLVSTVWTRIGTTPIYDAERYAMHVENQIRAENGLPLRTAYTTQSGRLIAPALIPGTRLSTNYFNNSLPAIPTFNPNIPVNIQDIIHIQSLYGY